MDPDRSDVAVHVPDGASLARTTDLAVGAHPDDLELLVPGVIGECRSDPDRWFAGIVCTDGAGSVPPPDRPWLQGAELAAVRSAEQRAAADLGGYPVAQLGWSSDELRTADGAAQVRAQLVELLRTCRPARVYTHDPFDRHPTHVAVCLAVVGALRSLPRSARPTRLLGCEGWRGLGWLPDGDRVELDVTGHEELASSLLSCFDSQLAAKRYDLAATGRRRANATLRDPRAGDEASELVVAVNLTPLLVDDELDPAALAARTIDRFRAEVVDGLGRAWRAVDG